MYNLHFNGHIQTTEQWTTRPVKYNNTAIRTLAVDGWAAMPSPLFAVPKCRSPPINGQCTNFILSDVAL